MTTLAAEQAFIENAPGQYFNPDGMYEFQCKDVIDAYCVSLWGNWQNTIRPGNAKDCWTGFNADYFDAIPNVAGDLTNFPQYGDVVITGGDKYNEFGHIFICIAADAYTMHVLQQNADGTASLPAQLGVLGYDQPGTGPVLGWLRPKLDGGPAPVAPQAPPSPSGEALSGIDISGYQQGINIGATGAQFAIVKATEGVGWSDPALDANTAALRAAGIPGGFYHFARPDNTPENTADAEAQTFISAVRDRLQPSDVVVLDWESDNTSDSAWALRWLDLVSAALGRTALIYMNLTEARSGVWGDVQPRYKLWLAQYPTSERQSWGPVNRLPSAPGWTVAMWQYSSTGNLPGWGGQLDLNVFYGGATGWGALSGAGTFTPVVPLQTPTTAPNQCIVEAGDTLYGIARQFGVDLDQLVAANRGINPNVIYPGQVLNLPVGAVTSQPVTPTGGAPITQCIVESGDTLFGIAQQFGVDLAALIALNRIADANLIQPGQVLNLPGGVESAPAPAPAAAVTQCVVEDGDTLSAIAAQFGTTVEHLVAVNGIADPDAITVGQVLNF
jgi:lysozyme